jgi:hypothetical protein
VEGLWGLCCRSKRHVVSIASSSTGSKCDSCAPYGVSMVHISLLTIFATLLLVGCSGSSRVEDIVPAWANTQPPSSTRYIAQRRQREAPGAPDAKPQEDARSQEAVASQQAEKPVARSVPEE